MKPLIYRDWERKLLVRQPQPTHFCLTVKRLNCTFAFFCLPAVWYYWWSLVPRNEVEGVITQSAGYDSNHQEVCKKIYPWLWIFFLWKTARFCSFIFSHYLSVHLSVCLPQFLSLCSYVHYVCIAEHAVCPWGVFLGRQSWHKLCI